MVGGYEQPTLVSTASVACVRRTADRDHTHMPLTCATLPWVSPPLPLLTSLASAPRHSSRAHLLHVARGGGMPSTLWRMYEGTTSTSPCTPNRTW